MLIKSTSGLELGGGISAPDASQGIPYMDAYKSMQVEFTFTCNLNPGVYFLNAGVMGSVGEDEIYLHRILDASVFRVISVNENTSTCFVDFNCHLTFINSSHLHS
jgi:lipopolysaccharide transport system ATP-binding protein